MHDLTSKYVGVPSRYNPNLRFLENEIRNYRIFALPGGTRSGKTYSTVQFIWRQMVRYSGATYSMVRQTMPALKATVLRDFIDIGTGAGLYTDREHNMTEKEYRHNGNLLDYFSAEDADKIRGRKRGFLYMNEAPELTWEVVEQLLFRTDFKIVIDYNPSYPESWVYDKILTRDDCASITTTYKDNPHLSPGSRAQIDWMQENDPEGYKIYGLGQRGELRGQIYKNWKSIKPDGMPAEYPSIWVIDFGFSNDPTVIGEFKMHNRAIYARERVCETGLDNMQIGIHLFFMGVTDQNIVIADSAEPKSIAELRRGWQLDRDYLRTAAFGLGFEPDEEELTRLQKQMATGFTVFGAVKGPDTIDQGISKLKQFEVFVTEDSNNAWQEYRKYRWAEDPKTGKLLNTPMDAFNHFMDTLRYFATSEGRYF